MEKKEEKIIYGAYYRKSEEDEGKQINSIKDQKRELDEIEEREKLHVAIKFPGESQSAHHPGRPIFADCSIPSPRNAEVVTSSTFVEMVVQQQELLWMVKWIPVEYMFIANKERNSLA